MTGELVFLHQSFLTFLAIVVSSPRQFLFKKIMLDTINCIIQHEEKYISMMLSLLFKNMVCFSIYPRLFKIYSVGQVSDSWSDIRSWSHNWLWDGAPCWAPNWALSLVWSLLKILSLPLCPSPHALPPHPKQNNIKNYSRFLWLLSVVF